MSEAAGDERKPGPLTKVGLRRRILPFAAVGWVAVATAGFSITAETVGAYLLAALLFLILMLAAFLLPWDRLPRWTQTLVLLAHLPVVGIVREATGGPSSPYTALVLLPLLLFATYGTRGEVLLCLAVQAAVVATAPLLDQTPGYQAVELNRAVLLGAVAALIGLTVSTQVSRLRAGARSVAEAEQRAREARDQFLGVLDAATQFSIIATDTSGTITVFNEGASRLLGYSSDQMIGLTPTVLHDPEELAERAEELDVAPGFGVLVAVARSSEADVRDWTYIRNTGERLTVSLTVSAIRAADKTPIGFIAIASDVTDQRRVERQVREQAQRANLINELTHAIRQDLDAVSVQRRAVTALGESLNADRVLIRITDEDDPVGLITEAWTRQGVPTAPTAAAPPAGIARLSHRSGGDDSALVIFDAEDDSRLSPDEAVEVSVACSMRGYLSAPMWVGARLMGWIAVHTVLPRNWTGNDVAIVRALARTVGAALLQAQTFEQEQEIVRRLRELDEVKSDFVSSVSHELRTPLTSIIGYLDMLVEGDAGPLNGEQMQLAEVVDRNSRRLLDLIEDLLSLSRIESSSTGPGTDRVDLATVVAEVHRTVLPILGARQLDVVVEVPADIGSVIGDGAQLERVLSNLVTNAVKFTPEGGRIAVRGTSGDGRARLCVTDTGIGIPQEEQAQLFTRFFRSSTSRDHAIQGTGLGLSIVKSIVENHGGSIAVQSAAGVGTTVTVELPLATELPHPAVDAASVSAA